VLGTSFGILLLACFSFGGTQSPPARVENRYAPHHIGVDGQGLGGIFRIDSTTARAGFRFTVPSNCTPEALWLFAGVVGNPGKLGLRFTPSLSSDVYQPDLSGASLLWPLPTASAPKWHRIELESGSVNFKTPRAQGEVLHVTLERQLGVFNANNRLELYSVRSRFPLQYTYRVESSGEPIQDDLNAFLYTANSDNSAEPYRAQKDNDASYHPLMLVECSSGSDFGNPYDVHTEVPIYGAHVYSQKMQLPQPFNARFAAMFVRGAGMAGDLGVPADDLYLTVVSTRLDHDAPPVVIYGPAPIARTTDRLFKSRSHWFGHWFPTPLQLVSSNLHEYNFELSSPGCALSSSTDGYLFSYSHSTLLNSPNYMFGRAERNGLQLEPSADAGIILRDYNAQTSIAIVDEIVGSILGPIPSSLFPTIARQGDSLRFGVLARNFAAVPTNTGGEVFSRILDRDSGATLSAAMLHSPIAANDENVSFHIFPMPAADIHMLVQVGHVEPPGSGLGGTLIVDDSVPLEVRLVP